MHFNSHCQCISTNHSHNTRDYTHTIRITISHRNENRRSEFSLLKGLKSTHHRRTPLHGWSLLPFLRMHAINTHQHFNRRTEFSLSRDYHVDITHRIPTMTAAQSFLNTGLTRSIWHRLVQSCLWRLLWANIKKRGFLLTQFKCSTTSCVRLKSLAPPAIDNHQCFEPNFSLNT